MRGRGLPSALRTENFAAATIRVGDTFGSFTRGVKLRLPRILSGAVDLASHAHAAWGGAIILLGNVVSVLVSTCLQCAQCKPRGSERDLRDSRVDRDDARSFYKRIGYHRNATSHLMTKSIDHRYPD